MGGGGVGGGGFRGVEIMGFGLGLGGDVFFVVCFKRAKHYSHGGLGAFEIGSFSAFKA